MRRNKVALRPHRPRDRAHPGHRRQLRDHDPRRARQDGRGRRASTTTTSCACAARPSSRPSARTATWTTRWRQDLAALRAMPGVRAVEQHPLPALAGRRQLDRDAARRAPRARCCARRSTTPTRRRFDTLGVQVAEGARLHRASDVERDTLRLRSSSDSRSARWAPDGLPTRQVPAGRGRSAAPSASWPSARARRWASCWRTPTATMYRVIGVIDDFYNPYGWPIHEYASSTPNYRAQLRGRRAVPGPRRAGPGGRGGQGAGGQRLLAVNAGRNLRVRTLDEIKAQYFGAAAHRGPTLMSWVIVLLVLVTSLGHRRPDLVLGHRADAADRHPPRAGRAAGRTSLRHFLLENWLSPPSASCWASAWPSRSTSGW